MTTIEESLLQGLESLHCVVEHGQKFKAKLKIGEKAYATLKAEKNLRNVTVTGLFGFGGWSAAAAIFKVGFWAKIGIFFGLVPNPIGWVIASAVVSGGVGYGVISLYNRYHGSRVDVVPKFINTHIDLLGAAIFDMLAGLALKIAASSGGVEESERRSIINYFVEEWGISADYAEKALPLLEENLDEATIKERVGSMMEYQLENPDCNPKKMKPEFMELLNEVAHADGRLDEQEKITMESIEREIDFHLSLPRRFNRSMKRMARGAWGKIKPSKATAQAAENDQDPST